MQRARPSLLVRVTCDVLLILAVLGVLALTTGSANSSSTVNLSFGQEIQRALDNPFGAPMVNLVGNLVLFAPIGFLLRFAHRWSLLAVTLTGGLFSVGIECAQYVLGRAADVDDVVLNTAGALIGAVVASVFLIRGRTDARTSVEVG